MSIISRTVRGVFRRERVGNGATAVRPSAVRDALRPLRMATLGQLAAELAASRSEVEAALLFWEHRGSVRKARSLELSDCGGGCGGGCGSSKPAPTRKRMTASGRKPAGVVTLFEWVDD